MGLDYRDKGKLKGFPIKIFIRIYGRIEISGNEENQEISEGEDIGKVIKAETEMVCDVSTDRKKPAAEKRFKRKSRASTRPVLRLKMRWKGQIIIWGVDGENEKYGVVEKDCERSKET